MLSCRDRIPRRLVLRSREDTMYNRVDRLDDEKRITRAMLEGYMPITLGLYAANPSGGNRVELRKRIASAKKGTIKTSPAKRASVWGFSLPPISLKTLQALNEVALGCLSDGGQFVDSYLYVQNPRAQFECNLRVTGTVKVKLSIGKTLTVSLRDFWPCWKWSEDGTGTRIFEKHGYRKKIRLLIARQVGHPLENLLEILAYTAIMVVKARESAPREGHIMGNVNRFLEVSGHIVESVEIDGITYGREMVQSKIDKLESYVRAAIASGQYKPKRGKLDDLGTEVFG